MKTPKRPRDPNQLAKFIVDVATGQVEDSAAPEKDAAAVERGEKGGAARAKKLTAEERTDAAKKAAAKRWAP